MLEAWSLASVEGGKLSHPRYAHLLPGGCLSLFWLCQNDTKQWCVQPAS